MGHNTLGVIPTTKRWNDVVNMLATDAATEEIVAASARAAERDLLSAADDPVFVEAVRLLFCIPTSARSDDFGDALRRSGLDIRQDPGVMDLVIAAGTRIDQTARQNAPTKDIGELAGRALTASLSKMIGDALPGLFEATPEDVQAAARRLSSSKGVAVLARDFFGGLLSETLGYWLERTLAGHGGPAGRFSDARDRGAFDDALNAYTDESTRIIKEFSGGWYGKTLHRTGEISTHDAAVFGAVAMKKIIEEMRRRGMLHA